MTARARVKARLPDCADELIDAALCDAGDLIMNYTNRRELPEALIGAQAALAVVSINRMGTEGESSHSEGGVSRTMDMLPEDIKAQLRPWRLAKVVNLHASS